MAEAEECHSAGGGGGGLGEGGRGEMKEGWHSGTYLMGAGTLTL